jgi:hypothetical protein
MTLLAALAYGTKDTLGRGSDADVFLAPHYDDVAFSLGSFAAATGRGKLHTVFSRSSFLLDNYQNLPLDKASRSERVELISSLRRSEDLAFAARVRLRATYAEIDEAPVRGHDPFEAQQAQADADRLGPKILDGIIALHPGGPVRPRLFAPMAIGAHLDHLVILLALVAGYAEISARYELLFYEDLHYASRIRRRIKGILRFLRLMGDRRFERVPLPIRDEAEKLELVRTYRSQFHDLPRDLRQFSPNLVRPTRRHEAIWRLEA